MNKIETLIANIEQYFHTRKDSASVNEADVQLGNCLTYLRQQGQGEPCSATKSCDLPNLQCAYPKCPHGEAKKAPPQGRELLENFWNDMSEAANPHAFADRKDYEAVWTVVTKYRDAVIAADRAIRPAGMALVPVEITGKQWSAGRNAFQQQVDAVEDAKGYELRSAIIDRAPEKIYAAMIAAAQVQEPK